MSLPTYQYTPLVGHDIRLLKLLPGTGADDIRVIVFHAELQPSPSKSDTWAAEAKLRESIPGAWELHETPEGRAVLVNSEADGIEYLDAVDDPTSLFTPSEQPTTTIPRFEALSYVWGRPGNEAFVSIVDDTATCTPMARMPVWPNLEAALRQLREETEDRTLWIDAICINQGALIERAQQVQRMDQIFGMASRVLVWLGSASADSNLALSLLRQLGDTVEIAEDWAIYPKPDSETGLYGPISVSWEPQEWDAVNALCRREWFKRVWTMQEIYKAGPDALVLCGQQSIRYYYLRRALTILALIEDKHPMRDDVENLVSSRNFIETGLKIVTPSRLLAFIVKAECSDPRDKIYGSMNLLGPKIRAEIEPSYTRRFEDVYKDFFLACTNVTGRLDLLCPRRRASHPFNGPSWVPDLRAPTKPSVRLGRFYSASAMTKAEVVFGDGDSLQVLGTAQDTIKVVHKPIDMTQEGLAKRLAEISPANLGLPSSYPTGENILDAWTRTLCLDEMLERLPAWDLFYFDLADTRELIQDVLQSTGKEEASFRDKAFFYFKMLAALRSLAFIQTEKGYIGLAHPDSRPGDQLCILLGCWCPQILREDSPATCSVVGDCYLHGIMDGEALLGPLPPGFKVQCVKSNRRWSFTYLQVFKDGSEKNHDDDPRLGDLPPDWVGLEKRTIERSADDSEMTSYFQNSKTKQIIKHDPRLTPALLRGRGIPLRTFALV